MLGEGEGAEWGSLLNVDVIEGYAGWQRASAMSLIGVKGGAKRH